MLLHDVDFIHKFSKSYLNVKIQVKQKQVVTAKLFIYCNVLTAAAPICLILVYHA